MPQQQGDEKTMPLKHTHTHTHTHTRVDQRIPVMSGFWGMRNWKYVGSDRPLMLRAVISTL